MYSLAYLGTNVPTYSSRPVSLKPPSPSLASASLCQASLSHSPLRASYHSYLATDYTACLHDWLCTYPRTPVRCPEPLPHIFTILKSPPHRCSELPILHLRTIHVSSLLSAIATMYVRTTHNFLSTGCNGASETLHWCVTP